MATRRQLAQAGLVAAGLLPLLGLIVAFGLDRLGVEPVETITHETGDWALRLLLLTLLVTPLRRLLGWNALAPFRRTLGLLSFFYASLHFATYLTFELGWHFTDLPKEIAERPYITVGFAAFVILSALAMTSTRGWIRRLARNWQRLHRLVYLAVILAVVHFLWLVKADLREPLIYAGIAATLLAWRLPPLLERTKVNYATLRGSAGRGRETS
ncbi:MAG: protein-methionine-sulfoxide reductase heme-binding subunit MsrQ [Myxococcota bacterium]